MQTNPFYIVDVFAEKKYRGNQLAVFTDAKSLTEQQMQHFASEMHFSETTFILSGREEDGGYGVRIFTPSQEVPFAGHPTLGTASVIHKVIAQNQPAKIVLNLKVGQIPVTFERDQEGNELVWMNQHSPSFGSRLSPEAVARSLNLSVDDIDARFPIEEVSTGLPFIILPLLSLSAVRQAQVSLEAFLALIKPLAAKAILIFCKQTEHPGHHLHVRVFAHGYGVAEDPATGSANGCLAAYLTRHRYYGEDHIDIRVEQGYEIGRPSLLFLRTAIRDRAIDVFVGGRVQFVAEGKFV